MSYDVNHPLIFIKVIKKSSGGRFVDAKLYFGKYHYPVIIDQKHSAKLSLFADGKETPIWLRRFEAKNLKSAKSGNKVFEDTLPKNLYYQLTMLHGGLIYFFIKKKRADELVRSILKKNK